MKINAFCESPFSFNDFDSETSSEKGMSIHEGIGASSDEERGYKKKFKKANNSNIFPHEMKKEPFYH